MTTKKLERLGTQKLSGEVSTSKNDLVNELTKISHKMIDILNKRENNKQEDIEYFNSIGYLMEHKYISPLFYLCELARFLDKKEWDLVINFWLQDYNFINNFIKKLTKDIIDINKTLDNNLQYKENKNGNN